MSKLEKNDKHLEQVEKYYLDPKEMKKICHKFINIIMYV